MIMVNVDLLDDPIALPWYKMVDRGVATIFPYYELVSFIYCRSNFMPTLKHHHHDLVKELNNDIGHS